VRRRRTAAAEQRAKLSVGEEQVDDRVELLLQRRISDEGGNQGQLGASSEDRGYLMREIINGNQGHSGRIGYLMREVIRGTQ
jgi:hypothetical protein